jgi:hypothetical protein
MNFGITIITALIYGFFGTIGYTLAVLFLRALKLG